MSRKALWLHPARPDTASSLARLFPPCRPIQRRCISWDAVQAFLLPPAIFGGLLVTLWTYKSLMLVIFQNKIIYMPGIPPFSRSEEIQSYAQQCKPIQWKEHLVSTTDGVQVKLLEGCLAHDPGLKDEQHLEVITLYFQGNASSLPPRLPALSQVLKDAIGDQRGEMNKSPSRTSYTILALSYRGFWTSRGRPSQAGLERDAQAALEWIRQNFDLRRTKIVLWGQSIGAGVATTATAHTLHRLGPKSLGVNICGLILETPFTSIKDMLFALYPQRFLPYRYLWPFLRSQWDSRQALVEISNAPPQTRLETLILQAGKDEIVPKGQAEKLEETCRQGGLSTRRVEVANALHTEILLKSQGRRLVSDFIRRIPGK